MTDLADDSSESKEELDNSVEGLRCIEWIMTLPVSDSVSRDREVAEARRRDNSDGPEGVSERGVPYTGDESRRCQLDVDGAVRRVVVLC